MTKFILSIDGGGIRGILPARMLEAIEERIGKPAGELFDLIAGTSTGGIIGCALSIGVPAKALVDLYVNDGGAIFSRGLGDEIMTADGVFGAKYGPAALEAKLKAVLGDIWLSQAKTKLLIPSYCIQLPTPADTEGDGLAEGACSWVFKSWSATDPYDFQLWQVARATAAAPTYFPDAAITNMSGDRFWMVDGAMFANNPAMCATAAGYLALPTIDHWEHRNTTWSNRPSRASVAMQIVDVSTGQVLTSTLLESRSRMVMAIGHEPRVAAAAPARPLRRRPILHSFCHRKYPAATSPRRPASRVSG